MITKDVYLEYVEQAEQYSMDAYGLPAHEVIGRDIEHEDVINSSHEELIDYYADKYGLTDLRRVWS